MEFFDIKTNSIIVDFVANNIVLILMLGAFFSTIQKRTKWSWLETILNAFTSAVGIARGSSKDKKESNQK
jgi:hypothetical protein